MLTRIPVAALIACASVIAFAVPAVAQDRPDIPDVNTGVLFDTSKSPTASGQFLASAVGSGFTVVQGASMVRNVTNAKGAGGVLMRLFEPDKATRTSKLLQLKQANYASLGTLIFSTAGTFGTFFVGPTAGCKAQAKVQDKNKNGFLETAQWNATCNKAALQALGLNPAQIAAVKKVFGGTLIKGKTVAPEP